MFLDSPTMPQTKNAQEKASLQSVIPDQSNNWTICNYPALYFVEKQDNEILSNSSNSQ